jgi:hypothetical protein
MATPGDAMPVIEPPAGTTRGSTRDPAVQSTAIRWAMRSLSTEAACRPDAGVIEPEG